MGQRALRLIAGVLAFVWLMVTGNVFVEAAATVPVNPARPNYQLPPYYQQQKPGYIPPTENIPPSGQVPPVKNLPPTTGGDPETDTPSGPDSGQDDSGTTTDQPSSPGSGGGGGGGAPSVPDTPTIESGQIATGAGVVTVEPASGGVKLTADEKKVADLSNLAKQANQGQVILPVLNPGGTPVKQYQAVVPLKALTNLTRAQQKLVIFTEEVSVTLPPAVLKEITGLLPGGELEFNAQRVSGTDSRGISQEAGETVDVQFSIKGTNGQKKAAKVFSKPLTLSLKFDSGTAQNMISRLGIYRLNEKNGAWEYMGGKADPDKGVISVERNSFSTYSVRLYEKGFYDLVGHWAKEDVELLSDRGVVKGFNELIFGPERNITRAEFAVLMQKALNLPAAKGTSFKDVRDNDWFSGGVGAVSEAGLVVGNPDGTFQPNRTITRQEIAVILARALSEYGHSVNIAGDNLNGFSDRHAVSLWAKPHMAVAVEAELIKGKGEGKLAPLSNATRAEAAVMLKRLMLNLNKL